MGLGRTDLLVVPDFNSLPLFYFAFQVLLLFHEVRRLLLQPLVHLALRDLRQHTLHLAITTMASE